MQAPINATIVDEELWRKFHPITEMILIKRGRSIFPKLAFEIIGLVHNLFYAFSIHFERCDNSKYKFNNGQWFESSRAEPAAQPRIMLHPKGFESGKDWMGQPLRFERLKITNDITSDKPWHYFLQSMHKYRPVLTVYQMGEIPNSMVPIQEFRFTIAEFIAVTSYQNNEVSKLKIATNKYARGFSGENKRKRAAAKMEKEANNSPHDMMFENPAKRAPWPAPQYYPCYDMQYNMGMGNFLYPQQQLPNYNNYPMAAPMYQPMDGEQMAYNPPTYWPQVMQPTMHQPFATTPNHSDSYQSISPEMTNHSF